MRISDSAGHYRFLFFGFAFFLRNNFSAEIACALVILLIIAISYQSAPQCLISYRPLVFAQIIS